MLKPMMIERIFEMVGPGFSSDTMRWNPVKEIIAEQCFGVKDVEFMKTKTLNKKLSEIDWSRDNLVDAFYKMEDKYFLELYAVVTRRWCMQM